MRKENARDQNIGVEDDLHFLFRTAAIALEISEDLIPWVLACFLARRINPSKSFMDGAVRVLKMMASPSPMTTNWDPAASWSLSRISSGMTTCPLEDIRVVASRLMAIFLLVRLHAFNNGASGESSWDAQWLIASGCLDSRSEADHAVKLHPSQSDQICGSAGGS